MDLPHLFIHSLVNDIWFAFWWKISAILITSLNNTALNTVQFLFQRTFFFNSQVASGLPWWLRWQVIPRSRYAGGMVMPTFWRATKLFSIVAVFHFTFLPTLYEGSSCLKLQQSYWVWSGISVWFWVAFT